MMQSASRKKAVLERFLAFSPGDLKDVRVFFAPGRVNLIGEHIDYNGGLVFPAALELGTWAIVRPRKDGVYRFASTAFANEVQVRVDELRYNPADDYANYPKGTIWALAEEGVHVTGADFLFDGNLPNGAGLSSSASIELATACAVNAIHHGGLSSVRLAQLAQKAENEFVGVNCGIMDQFAVAAGKKNHAILLDCATLDYRLVPLDIRDCKLIVTNTNKRRELADSKYNERRAECERALAQLQSIKPSLSALAELSPEEWESLQSSVDDEVLRRRVRHVVTEQARVHQAAEALASGNIERFGQLLNDSHASLRDDYEVTGAELDALAEAAWEVEGCVGSRMTGAGFGGCTVALVRADAVDRFQAHVAEMYRKRTGLDASFYVSDVGDGAREVTEEVL